MKWTSEKPTKPGYYWQLNESGDAQVLRVYQSAAGRLFAASFADWETPVSRLDGQWAGPLEEPQE